MGRKQLARFRTLAVAAFGEFYATCHSVAVNGRVTETEDVDFKKSTRSSVSNGLELWRTS